MTGFDDDVDELLAHLCDCNSHHECQWHLRLRMGEARSSVEKSMWEELDERHRLYAIEMGYL